MKLACAIVLVVLTAASAYAADGIKAGKWEYSVQMQMPNMPKLPPGVQLPPGVSMNGGGMSVTHTTCVDSATPIPADSHTQGQHGQCKNENVDVSGGVVRWNTTCAPSNAGGVTVRSEGEAHYNGDTMEADIKTATTGGNMPVQETKEHITGRYLGACDAK